MQKRHYVEIFMSIFQTYEKFNWCQVVHIVYVRWLPGSGPRTSQTEESQELYFPISIIDVTETTAQLNTI